MYNEETARDILAKAPDELTVDPILLAAYCLFELSEEQAERVLKLLEHDGYCVSPAPEYLN